MFYKLRELFEYTTNKEIVFHKSIDEIFKELIFKDIGENFFNIFPNEEEWSIYGLESEEVKEVLYEALTVFGNPSEIKVLDMQPEAYKSFIINLIKENTTPIIKGGVKRIGNAQVYFKYDLNIGIIYLYENDDVIYKISTNGAKYTLQSNLLATIKERLKFTYVMLYFIFKTDMLSIEAKERHLQPYLTFGKQRKYTYLDLVDFEGLYKGYIHLKEQVSIPYYDLPEYLLTQSDLVSVLGLEKLDAVEIDEEILCTLQSVGTFIYRDLIASKDNYKGANKLSIQESISTATLKSLLGLKRGEYIYPGKTNYGGKLNKTFLLGYPDFLNVVMENNFGDDYLDHLLEVQFFFDWGYCSVETYYTATRDCGDEEYVDRDSSNYLMEDITILEIAAALNTFDFKKGIIFVGRNFADSLFGDADNIIVTLNNDNKHEIKVFVELEDFD